MTLPSDIRADRHFVVTAAAVDLQETAGNVAWANDNKTLFYVTKDKLDRPFKVSTAKLHYHRLVGSCA